MDRPRVGANVDISFQSKRRAQVFADIGVYYGDCQPCPGHHTADFAMNEAPGGGSRPNQSIGKYPHSARARLSDRHRRFRDGYSNLAYLDTSKSTTLRSTRPVAGISSGSRSTTSLSSETSGSWKSSPRQRQPQCPSGLWRNGVCDTPPRPVRQEGATVRQSLCRKPALHAGPPRDIC